MLLRGSKLLGFLWLNNVLSHIDTTLYLSLQDLSAGRPLHGRFYLLAVMNNVTMCTSVVPVPAVSSGVCVSRNRIAGSYGVSVYV